jgi:glycerol-3-phosphate cytidylyltransferase-like family protein
MSAGLDTRHKILTLQQARSMFGQHAPELPPSLAFVTHMEVLRPGHIRKLEELAATRPGKLFVILTDPVSPLVPLDARAEVTAALRVVDYVIPSPDGPGPALAAIQPVMTVHDEEEDRGRTRLLVEHVRSRARV